mmetsp:Transcript_13712/g.12152  ORF Transcript_13712/g.12152 Transcript_13712/m.12152 type:complete len:88 (+) Transcript_13712:513-776(+)
MTTVNIDQIAIDVKSDISQRTESLISFTSKNEIYSNNEVQDDNSSESSDEKEHEYGFDSIHDVPLPTSDRIDNSIPEAITKRKLSIS